MFFHLSLGKGGKGAKSGLPTDFDLYEQISHWEIGNREISITSACSSTKPSKMPHYENQGT